jgi:peptide chain release factor 1
VVRLRLASCLSDQFVNNVEAATAEAIPPALLKRARDITLEHKQLTEKLSDGFDTRAAKKLGEYSSIVNALGEWDKANEVSNDNKKINDNTVQMY